MQSPGKHIFALWTFLIVFIPAVFTTSAYIFTPRLEALIKSTIEHEIRDPDNKVFIECLILVERHRWMYDETSEDLLMFQNAVDNGHGTSFHRSEIRRLTQKQKVELADLVADKKRPCSER